MLEIRAGLGESLHMLGRLAEAEEAEHREAFDGYGPSFGPDRPDALVQRGRPADLLSVQGEFGEYRALLNTHDGSRRSV
ncbi:MULTISPECIES: hypothetical protein [unclassified Nonomuraea]|uniref:hypothetical protein n=1 Tax=unclassified Nonomuraea TaxID=2593643 RepID=UPI00340487AC